MMGPRMLLRKEITKNIRKIRITIKVLLFMEWGLQE